MEEYSTPTRSYVEFTYIDYQAYIISYYRNGAWDYIVRVEVKRPWYMPNKTIKYFQYGNSLDAERKYRELLKLYNQTQ